MFNPSSGLAKLLAAPVRQGEVAWIGVRPVRRAPMVALESAVLIPDKGFAEDHYRGRPNGGRQVTLIGAENLASIASFVGMPEVTPEMLRRNLVLRGVNLLALKGRRFRIGAAVLEYSGECHPCSRMEETLGVGGYNAVRGQGGIIARVIEGGAVSLGDPVMRLD